jgi:hypothetical protein
MTYTQFAGRALVSVLFCTAASAGTLEDLYKLSPARTARVSSADPNWQNGNGDCRPIEHGKTLTVADIKGAGVIRHLWFTIAADDPAYGRSMVLRIYWDGEDEPAVESPIGDFFAVGHGLLRTVNSMPVAVGSDGRALNCYWPMPFTKGARITISNDSKKYRVGCVYSYVDYEEMDEAELLRTVRQPGTRGGPAPAIATFHAQYRQEYPAKMGEDYLLLDAEGEGQYVGTVLSAQFRTAGWFGEGDDRFYIDGAKEPQLRGTGTEDYFCEAWGFRQINFPFYGVSLWEGYELGNRVTAYRWHINDPVHFKKSLKATIEHKGQMAGEDRKFWSGFEERADLFSSVAYWYQTGKAKRFATIPPVEERTVARKVVELDALRDKLQVEPADTVVEVQNGPWSGGKQLLVQFKDPKAVLTIPFELKEPLKGLGELRLTKSWDYGQYNVTLDGKELPGLKDKDLYSTDVLPRGYTVGFLDLAAGQHTLKFECVGKNPESKGYYLGVDALVIDELTPYLVNKPKAEHK